MMGYRRIRKYLRPARRLWEAGVHYVRSRSRRHVSGRFQPYSHTLADRYPWLFGFAASRCDAKPNLLSFGCSRGEEIASLRKYFPGATIRGLDVNKRNIARCRKRFRETMGGLSFETAADTRAEDDEGYDAIFCLAVLVHGDLTTEGHVRCDPLLRFDDFEKIVTDFHRCLKPGGYLFLHTCNFRFCDTAVARNFDVVLVADASQMAADAKYDRENRLMNGVQYFDVGFRKRPPGL